MPDYKCCPHDEESHLPAKGFTGSQILKLRACMIKDCSCDDYAQDAAPATDDELKILTGISPLIGELGVLHEAYLQSRSAGFSEHEALFILCWAAFGPQFDSPTEDQ